MLFIKKQLLASAFVLAGLLGGWSIGTAAGQTLPDSSRVSYGVETIAEPTAAESGLQQKYGQLVRLQVEEQQLWKVGLNDFTSRGSGTALRYLRTGVHLIYERKVRTAWSVMGEVSPEFIRFRNDETASLRNSFAVRSQLAGRYYYNLNRRIRKGKSASNFSANYLSLALGSSIGKQAQETPYYRYNHGGPVARLDAALLYGLQRRLGHYGFVDFNFGVPIHISSKSSKSFPRRSTSDLVALMRIGLAIGR
jgi:hypothetical protein